MRLRHRERKRLTTVRQRLIARAKSNAQPGSRVDQLDELVQCIEHLLHGSVEFGLTENATNALRELQAITNEVVANANAQRVVGSRFLLAVYRVRNGSLDEGLVLDADRVKKLKLSENDLNEIKRAAQLLAESVAEQKPRGKGAKKRRGRQREIDPEEARIWDA